MSNELDLNQLRDQVEFMHGAMCLQRYAYSFEHSLREFFEKEVEKEVKSRYGKMSRDEFTAFTCGYFMAALKSIRSQLDSVEVMSRYRGKDKEDMPDIDELVKMRGPHQGEINKVCDSLLEIVLDIFKKHYNMPSKKVDKVDVNVN